MVRRRDFSRLFLFITIENCIFALMEHEKYMQRCLQLAQNGLGTTYPNPMVGCVIVHKQTIIGEGWHYMAGMPHAEVNAISCVKNQQILPQSTLYVTLEPCSHFGKTPPCADLIISKNIKNIVVGTKDTFCEVSGKGIEKLRNAGCKVEVGILEEQCREINKRFFTFHNKNRPYIILKWAETADGFIAPTVRDTKNPIWISGSLSQQITHKWRSEEQAILVGKNTILDDNPALTTRHWAGKNPLRLVIDADLEIPLSFSVFDAKTPTVIFSSKEKKSVDNIDFHRIDFHQSVPKQICEYLFEQKIQSVIIEGGAFTLQQFIDANLWDEARVFIGKSIFEKGIKAPMLLAVPQKKEAIGDDLLLWFENQKI